MTLPAIAIIVPGLYPTDIPKPGKVITLTESSSPNATTKSSHSFLPFASQCAGVFQLVMTDSAVNGDVQTFRARKS